MMFSNMLMLLVILPILNNAIASETPVIGILTQEAYLIRKAYPEAHSFIAASFVKLVESSGGRVLPIWIGQDEDYYQRVVNYTNGIIFPGGGTYFNETGGYGEAAKQIYELAVKTNQNGVHYPLWGICLGMQVLMFGVLGRDIRGLCQSKDVALPLNFVTDFHESKLFANASTQLLDNLKTKNLTYNYHGYCLFESDLKENHILEDWKIISTNQDINKLEFVSTIEHKTYPFYGTQYHPEKNAFEFKKPSEIPHSSEAIEFAQYLGNFFINEAKKNNHTFPSAIIEDRSLIYNYSAVYSAANTSYVQLYLFNLEDYSNNLLK